MSGKPKPLLFRFWSKVDIKDNPDECWNWRACISNKGYGRFMINRKVVPASRMSYIITNGPIVGKYEVCHTCDNPLCVNPNHLFLGTRKQNMEDAKNKGRLSSGEKHSKLCTGNRAVGERSGKSKLTEKQVREIRRLYTTTETSYKKLAKRFAVSPSAVAAIIKNKRWTHLI